MNEFPVNEFRELGIEQLEFDKENPRLPTSVRGKDDASIIKYLASKTGIENLMSSIGENGFFPGEAIVVTPHDSKYIVIEGNRRLAALRLLQDPTLARVPGIGSAAAAATYKPVQVPVYVVPSREDTLQYLGFRHISGVQRWDPLAKTRYLETLFNRTQGEPEQRYVSVAREIGSKSPTVRRNLDALAAYKIIEQMDFYNVADIGEGDFQFGTFYTAVSNVEIANFIGTRKEGIPTHPITDPDVIDRTHLGELVKFMFERDARSNTKLGESRNIGKLGEVLANPDSLQALRLGQSLESAYRLTPDSRNDFMRHMNQAIEELKQANANLYAVRPDDQTARDSVREASQIIQWASDRLDVST